MKKTKVKKVNKNAIIPTKRDGDAGYDLTAVSKSYVKGVDGNEYIEYDTGLAFELPKGYVGLIFPRSSVSNKGLTLSNAVGVIDQSFRGNVTARFKKIGNGAEYEVGDRICQLVVIPLPKTGMEEVEELSPSERGTGAYGSTDEQETN